MSIQKSYLWRYPLTPETYLSYAARYYTGFACWEEFLKDLNMFSSTSKQLMHKKNAGLELPARKLLNDFVTLGNVFHGDALARLAFFLSNPKCWSEIKTLLHALFRLPRHVPEAPVGKIPFSPALLEQLKRI